MFGTALSRTYDSPNSTCPVAAAAAMSDSGFFFDTATSRGAGRLAAAAAASHRPRTPARASATDGAAADEKADVRAASVDSSEVRSIGGVGSLGVVRWWQMVERRPRWTGVRAT